MPRPRPRAGRRLRRPPPSDDSRVRAPFADCGRLRPAGKAASPCSLLLSALPFVRCVSLPSSAVLLVAVAVARRCAPKGLITAKTAPVRPGVRSVATNVRLGKAAAVSPSAFRFTCDVALRQAALAPLHQVPHAAPGEALRSAELGLPTASSPERQDRQVKEKAPTRR